MQSPIPSDQIKYRNYRRFPIMVALALTFVYGLVLVGAVWFGGGLSNIAMPAIILIIFWVVGVSLAAVYAGMLTRWERRGIDALFSEPPWAAWEYTPEEWQADYEQMYRGEKSRARASCGYLLVGLVLGAVFVIVAFFTRNSPYASFLLLVGVVVGVGIMLLGIVQFYVGRAEAEQHYRQAQQMPTPSLIFGREGIYHPSTGFSSLKGLRRAEILLPDSSDRMQRAIYAYINKLYGSTNLSYLRFHMPSRRSRRGGIGVRGINAIPIPQRYQASAEQLVERYINELGLKQR